MRLKKIDEPWDRLSARALTRGLSTFDGLYSLAGPGPAAWSRETQARDDRGARRGTYIFAFHRHAATTDVAIGVG